MNDGEWSQIMIAVAIIAAMFVYPIIVFTLEGRKERRAAREAESGDDSASA